MNINWLRNFVVIAQCNSFSVAADVQYSSQSNVSKHLKALEKELGVQLFERTTRTAKLTGVGKELLPHAESIVKEYDILLTRADAFRNADRDTISIYSVPIIHMIDLGPEIEKFKQFHPKCYVNFNESNILEVLEYFRQSPSSVAILRDVATRCLPKDMKLNIFPFIDDEIVMLCAKEHPYAKLSSIPIMECLHSQLAVLSTGTVEYQMVLEDLGIPPSFFKPTLKCSSFLYLQQYLTNNHTVSLITKNMAKMMCQDHNLVFRHLDERPKFPLNIVVREKAFSGEIRDLINMIINTQN